MDNNEQQEQRRILGGEAALELWRKGQKEWNNWIDKHEDWEIHFTDIDFSSEQSSSEYLSFQGYNFGNGGVVFFRTSFGSRNVTFAESNFGKKETKFIETTFDGNIDFSNSVFAEGGVRFFETDFGTGQVSFANSKFEQLTVVKCNFGEGGVNFTGTKFGSGETKFYLTKFGSGEVDFTKAEFETGGLKLFEVEFASGNVSFKESKFVGGDLDFDGTRFGMASVSFFDTTFKNCRLLLDQAHFHDLFFRPRTIDSIDIQAIGASVKNVSIFILPSPADTLWSLDFQGTSFNGPFFLNGHLNIIPDLRATNPSHQVDLCSLKTKLNRSWQWGAFPPKLSKVANDSNDASRLRRLKEIAETNKDHQAALRFSADENRARRWIEISWLGSILDMGFSFFSDYGQSILRPFATLFLLSAASIGLYKKLIATTGTEWWAGSGWAQSSLLSISNSLPFLPQSSSMRNEAIKVLYSNDPSIWVDAIMIGQGTLSFIFLFLIGLGLRNRFRL